MNRFRYALPVALTALLMSISITAPVAAGDPQEAEHKTIKIKKIKHDCDGDDCPDHKVLIEKMMQDCEGDDCPEHGFLIKQMMHDCEGDDCPEIQTFHLGDVMHECEGDDCPDHDVIIKKVMGDCEGDDCSKVEKIHIKKLMLDCEGDDCPEMKHERRVIMIGDDGEVHQLGGDHRMQWIGKGGPGAFTMRHPGKGGFLGVATSELTPELRGHFGVPEDAGVLVAKVVEDSAAATAGVQVGDILTAVDGESVESAGDLIHAIGKREPGVAVGIELYRDGTLHQLSATLGERQPPRRHAMVMHCDDDDADCPKIATLRDFDCGGDSDCEIEIKCEDSGCECTVNGETSECETLPGFEAPGE